MKIPIKHFLYLAYAALSLFLSPLVSADDCILYIGTGGKKAEGIYQTTFDQATGQFSEVCLSARIDSPGFLTLHPKVDILYAVAKWQKKAGVIGYRIGEDGALSEFTREPCPDGMGCHLAVHPSGKFLLTAQYGGGSVAFFPLDDGGNLSVPTIFKHEGGSKVFEKRQESPHPHWCGFSPCGNYALVPDLGLDRIVVYRIDRERKLISPHGKVISSPGGGPRHMKFSTNGKYLYLLNELSLSVESFSWDPNLGSAASISLVKTLTENEKKAESFNSAAEILVHSSGKWVYSSNRGHDSVTAFKTEKDGSLQTIQKQPIRGAFPRNINFSPDGHWLLAAGQDSNTISAHKIDQANGKLTYLRGATINVPNPICLLFKKRGEH